MITDVIICRWYLPGGEGVECYNYSPLIYAYGCQNITITGEGILDGCGQSWWSWKKLQQDAANRLCRAESLGIRPEDRVFGTETDALRPSFLQLIHCEHVVLKDFTIQDGPQWTIHPVYCRHVQVQRVRILTHGPNTDGINPDSCEDVLIEKCSFSTGDDCIAINSGLNEDGWRVNRPCRRVEVRDCVFLGGHAAVAIGSGMSGGVEQVDIHDCTIRNTERGIRIKSMPGRRRLCPKCYMPEYDHRAGGRRRRAGQYELRFQYGSSCLQQGSGVLRHFLSEYRDQGSESRRGSLWVTGEPGKVRLDKVRCR